LVTTHLEILDCSSQVGHVMSLSLIKGSKLCIDMLSKSPQGFKTR